MRPSPRSQTTLISGIRCMRGHHYTGDETRLCYTPTMRRGKTETGYAVEESVRGSVSVDALQKLEYCCTNTDGKIGYTVEESVRGSAAPRNRRYA